MSLTQYFTYLERSTNLGINLVEQLLIRYPKLFEKHSQPNRIKNKTNISSDEFAKTIKQVLGQRTAIKIISPKSPDAMSSKYDTFDIKTADGMTAKIILTPAGEPTKGHDFEKVLTKKLQKAHITIDEDAKAILKKMNLDVDDIAKVEQTSTIDTRRSEMFGFDGPKQVGRKIADITVFTTDGKEHYISAKAKNATFIYNGKNISFIHVDQKDPKEKVIFDQKFFVKTDLNVRIFQFLGIDPKRVAAGLNERIAIARKESGQWETLHLPNQDLLRKLLASAYGYGYWLVQEELEGPLTITHLKNAADAERMIGRIDSCEIKYPYHKSKSLTVKFTTHGKHETTKYYLEVRNSKGKLAPLDLRIKKVK